MKLGFLGLTHGDDIIQSNPGIIRNPAHLDKIWAITMDIIKKKKKNQMPSGVPESSKKQ